MDSHDYYASIDDDDDDDAMRLAPNPAKAKAKLVQDSARAHRDAVANTVSAAMLAISNPEPGGTGTVITNQLHNDIHAPLVKAEDSLIEAEDAYRDLDAKIPLGESRLGVQVLDTETKRFTHILRMSAFNTAVTLAREIRTNTGYKRANREAHNLVAAEPSRSRATSNPESLAT